MLKMEAQWIGYIVSLQFTKVVAFSMWTLLVDQPRPSPYYDDSPQYYMR